MPIYTFRCAACDAEFEQLMRMSDDPPACPDCGGAEVKRLLSNVAVHGKTAEIFASARKQAAREGHFSNYSKAEKSGLKP